MKNFIKADTLATFNSSGLTTSFKAINSSGFSGPAILIRIYNGSDKDITISYDGATSHDFIKAGENAYLNFQANSSPNNYVSMMKKGTVVYVKGSGAGTGTISLSAYYLES